VLGITNSELVSSPRSLNRCNEERPSVGGMAAALLAPAAYTVWLADAAAQALLALAPDAVMLAYCDPPHSFLLTLQLSSKPHAQAQSVADTGRCARYAPASLCARLCDQLDLLGGLFPVADRPGRRTRCTYMTAARRGLTQEHRVSISLSALPRPPCAQRTRTICGRAAAKKLVGAPDLNRRAPHGST
jgi:hypothetical protein